MSQQLDWRQAAAARGLKVTDLAEHVGTAIESIDLGDEHDAEMVAIAGAIIRQRTGKFDPGTFRDGYQEALQQLIEAKMQGLAIKPGAVSTPSPVIDLMAALKRSLAEEAPTQKRSAASRQKPNRAAPDRRQAALLLPLSGRSKRNGERSAGPATIGTRRRRKA